MMRREKQTIAKKYSFFVVLYGLVFANTHAQEAFITTWKTDANNEAITIYTGGTNTQYTIDWGDDTIEFITEGFNPTHTYAAAGVHEVKIIGDIDRIFMNNQEGSHKLLSVEQWGSISWSTMNSAFEGCSNLVLNATDTPDLTRVTDLSEMFKGATKLVDHQDKIGSWDVSGINLFTEMFSGAESLDEDLGAWDISGLPNTLRGIVMLNMFSDAHSFSTLNYDKLLIGWSTLEPGETRIPNVVDFTPPPTPYCLGESAREKLINDHYWNFRADYGKSCDTSLFELKVFLQGPYNTANDLMDDHLRLAGVIPVNSTYGDENAVNNSVLNVVGDDAIVDWISVEVRDSEDITNVLYSTSAVLQRDGDVVDVDGTSSLAIDVPGGAYYISVNHRNHVVVVTNTTANLMNNTVTIDFTIAANVRGTT